MLLRKVLKDVSVDNDDIIIIIIIVFYDDGDVQAEWQQCTDV